MVLVLVIDDSFFIRGSVAKMLETDKEIKVIKAGDYREAVGLVKEKRPDVIVLNAEMPGISGYDILYSIKQISPTPAILMSPDSELGMKEALNAFKYGVVDFIPLPPPKQIDAMKDELIALVKVAMSVDISRLKIPEVPRLIRIPRQSDKIILIGASSGGPPAIEYVLSALPSRFPSPILVVQHMPPFFTKSFAERLNKICDIRVKEAEDGDKLESGRALIAPGGFNLELVKKPGGFVVKLNRNPAKIVPNINMAFGSASTAGNRVMAILLTGMGDDGADGAKRIKKSGGHTIVQDKATSVIFGIPRSVIEKGCADFVLPLKDIPKKIIELL